MRKVWLLSVHGIIIASLIATRPEWPLLQSKLITGTIHSQLEILTNFHLLLLTLEMGRRKTHTKWFWGQILSVFIMEEIAVWDIIESWTYCHPDYIQISCNILFHQKWTPKFQGIIAMNWVLLSLKEFIEIGNHRSWTLHTQFHTQWTSVDLVECHLLTWNILSNYYIIRTSTHDTTVHSHKILTIQQGEPCYLSIWSNPCTLHKE